MSAETPPPTPLPYARVEISSGAALGITYGTLTVFLIATFVAGFFLWKDFTVDKYLTARNSQKWPVLALSLYSSAVGAWVLFAVPEASILGGPLALVGYAIGCVLPLAALDLIAPAVRSRLPHGITFTEFVQKRYGAPVEAYMSLIAILYMFLYLAAEFTAVADAVTLLSKLDADRKGKLGPILGVSLVTLAYTSIGGLPVSLATDQIQGVGVAALAIIVSIGAFYYSPIDSDAERDAFEAITSYDEPYKVGDGFSMMVILVIAVTTANLMHAGVWQRIWSAESNRHVRIGAWVAVAIAVVIMVLVGVVGWVAYAQYTVALYAPDYVVFLAGFFAILEMPVGWHVLAIILTVAMVASTADTLQTGLVAIFSPAVARLVESYGPDGDDELAGRTKDRLKMGINLGLAVCLNIPAIVLAEQNISVLNLFLFADLLCAATIIPLLMGFYDFTHPLAALAGCVSGQLTWLITYAIGGACCRGDNDDSWRFGFWSLWEPGSLYLKTSLVSFCLAPTISLLVTLAISPLCRKLTSEPDAPLAARLAKMGFADFAGWGAVRAEQAKADPKESTEGEVLAA